jgi:creatinine amidohydrolase
MRRVGPKAGWRVVALLAAVAALASPALAQSNAPPANNGGYSIFTGTIADMTYPAYAAAVKNGAVGLWGLGVVEEHGPHLPLASDIYIPTAVLGMVRERLAAGNIPSVTIPIFYWGVNQVTSAFPGSVNIRPEIMVELMQDVFRSLKKDGLTRVFCISGHNDVAHNRAIYDGVARAAADPSLAGLRVYFVTDPAMVARLGLSGGDANVALADKMPQPPPGQYFDVHAGAGETSMLWSRFPDVVAVDQLSKLKPYLIDAAALSEWRKGGEHAMRITPDGYTGDLSKASPEIGARVLTSRADAIAEAVRTRLAADK